MAVFRKRKINKRSPITLAEPAAPKKRGKNDSVLLAKREEGFGAPVPTSPPVKVGEQITVADPGQGAPTYYQVVSVQDRGNGAYRIEAINSSGRVTFTAPGTPLEPVLTVRSELNELFNDDGEQTLGIDFDDSEWSND